MQLPDTFTAMLLQRLFALLCCWLSLHATAQAPVFTSARFGSLKLKAPLDSVNAHLDKKISISRAVPDDELRYDTVLSSLGGIALRLVLMSGADERHKLVTTLVSIYSEDSRLVTRGGISPGLSKFELVRLLDGSELIVSPDTEKGKAFSRVQLYDRATGNSMTFFFRDNLLYAIEIQPEEYYDC
ncbi:MAG: hypothetical protein EOP50_09595 [Sphingobacteriales bacterium]|nr:MAG: hypothetical protein EOP50_09595 [Sphingobacteriales bacterium]